MGFWANMFMYNKMNKKMGDYDLDEGFSQSIPINMNDATTEFKKIATITPQLGGSIYRITLNLKYLVVGEKNTSTNTAQIRKTDGTVISEISNGANIDPEFPNVEVNAFETYEIYFKNSHPTGLNYNISVPESISCRYGIIETKNYLSLATV